MTYTVYSLVCKNGATNYTYVDYTRNLTKIKYHHKQNLLRHTGTLYDNIREFGGWSNWDVCILDTCDSVSMAEATAEKHKSGLINTNFTTDYNCDACDFVCNNKSDYERHTKTNKHKRQTSNVPVYNKKNTGIENSQQQFMNEMFKHNIDMQQQFMNEMFKHNTDIQQQFMNEIVKSNQELQQQVIELSTKQPIQQITNVVQQNNTQNNSFSIQVFLNETCGDAFNLSDILKSMVITNEDLVYNTQVGFVQGMTAIIKREMCDKIPLVKRPVHCTDLKRETVFYRENNVWHKEEGKTVEEDIMFQLTRSCLRTYLEWRKVHPDAENMRSEFNTLCDKIQVSVMPGYEKDKLYPKTMTEIYKHCLIDKKNMR
jgi:hypothetical protein